MNPLDTHRLVRYRSFQRHVTVTRRRVVWLWLAFAVWLGVLAWVGHRIGAL